MKESDRCLFIFVICIGVWNIIYSIIQMVVFVWQISILKEYKWSIKTERIDNLVRWPQGYEARFPGLDFFYVESTQTRVNACWVIAIIILVISPIHLITSSIMLCAVVKQTFGVICLWFVTVIPMIVLPTIYAVVWWNGNKFDDQLTMSVFEFTLALAITMPFTFITLCFINRIRKSRKNQNWHLASKNSELAYFEKEVYLREKEPKNSKIPIRRQPYRNSTGWSSRTCIPNGKSHSHRISSHQNYENRQNYSPTRSTRSSIRIGRSMNSSSQNELKYLPERKRLESMQALDFRNYY